MSKFLKFIVGLILVVFIAAGAALIVPQFLGGIDTVIVQEKMISNKTVGTVLYSKKEAVSDLQVGDQVLDMDTDTLYVQEVISYDAASQTAHVTGSNATTVRLGDTYTRVLFSVPLIGYLTIATQSTQGLILLGILLGLVIFMFIISEVLRRGEAAEEEDVFTNTEDDDDGFYRGLAEKRAESGKLPDMVSPVAASPLTEAAAGTDDPSIVEVGTPSAPLGLFPDESDELARADLENDEDAVALGTVRSDDGPADGIIELSEEVPRGETAAEGSEEKPLGTGELPDVQAALEAALENQQLNRSDRPVGIAQPVYSEQPADETVTVDENGEIELAMPVFSREELISKAYEAGLDPVVREDTVNGITFIDYSDCL